MCGVVASKGNIMGFYLREKGQTLQGEKAIKHKLS